MARLLAARLRRGANREISPERPPAHLWVYRRVSLTKALATDGPLSEAWQTPVLNPRTAATGPIQPSAARASGPHRSSLFKSPAAAANMPDYATASPLPWPECRRAGMKRECDD